MQSISLWILAFDKDKRIVYTYSSIIVVQSLGA